MSVETLIASLSPEDKRNALELLWASIERDAEAFTPPDWHGEVLADRLNNPSPESAVPLQEAMEDVRRRVSERRSSP
ncbi:MAG: addiction module protein [Planctomycetota bacterium]